MTFWFSIIVKTGGLYGRTQIMLLLKEFKHQLSVYDIMHIVRIFFMPVLHFSSDGALLQGCKQDDT